MSLTGYFLEKCFRASFNNFHRFYFSNYEKTIEMKLSKELKEKYFGTRRRKPNSSSEGKMNVVISFKVIPIRSKNSLLWKHIQGAQIKEPIWGFRKR